MKRSSFVCSALLVLLIAAVSGCATKSDNGWITLLDGAKGLENFDAVGHSNWAAVDGAIQADKRGKDTGFLVTKNMYTNF